jgi:hypothetical protein
VGRDIDRQDAKSAKEEEVWILEMGLAMRRMPIGQRDVGPPRLREPRLRS